MLLIDKNSSQAEHVLVDFLNEKMVTDIEYRIDGFVKNGIAYYNITFKVFTLHMEFGIQSTYFFVEGRQGHNKDVLIDNINSYYKGIKGLVA
jgi:hypothetical protein